MLLSVGLYIKLKKFVTMENEGWSKQLEAYYSGEGYVEVPIGGLTDDQKADLVAALQVAADRRARDSITEEVAETMTESDISLVMKKLVDGVMRVAVLSIRTGFNSEFEDTEGHFADIAV